LAAREATDDARLYARGLTSLARIPSDQSREVVRQRAADNAAPPEARGAALAALSIFDGSAAAELTLKFLAGLDASQAKAGETAVAALVARSDGLAALRKALSATKDLEWKADGARTLMAALRNAPGVDDVLLGEVVAATHFDALGWKWSDAWAGTIIQQATTSGDAARGETVYRQARLQCVRCHAIGQSGGAIGPNLVSLGGSSPPEYILQSLIDPNAKLKEGFQTLAVLTDDGRVVTGLQRARTDTQLQLVLADGTEQTLAIDSIDSINPGRSIMPAGLVDILTEQELVDLTRFLMELGRSPDFTVDTAPRVRNWSVLNWSQAAHTLLNRTSVDSAASDAKELTWSPLTSTVAGVLPLAEAPVFQPRPEAPAIVFVSFDIDCTQAGTVRFEFTARPETFSMWLDGRPQPTPSSDQQISLTTGKHRVVLGLKVKEVGATFGCQVRSGYAGAAIVELKPRS
jgi:putative heme-binding domain-containing protein